MQAIGLGVPASARGSERRCAPPQTHTFLADSCPPRSRALMWQLPMVISALPNTQQREREREREREKGAVNTGKGGVREWARAGKRGVTRGARGTHPLAVWAGLQSSFQWSVCEAG